MKLLATNRISLRLLILAATVLVSGFASTAAAYAATYSFQQGTSAIVASTTDTGNHCDDCVTNVVFPFTYTLYGVNYTSANAGANGNLQFGNGSGSNYAGTSDLPNSSFPVVILALQNDLRTDRAGGGIYTSVSGAAPNRIFNIEWRAVLFENTSQSVNFEIRLFEGLSRFDLIYGTLMNNGVGVVGVQKDNSDFTQYAPGASAGLQLTATMAPTAAAISIGGRVTVGEDGLARARVNLIDSSGEIRTTITDAFGYYRFDDVAAGETIVLNVFFKNYIFSPQVINVSEDSNELNFAAPRLKSRIL